MLNTGETATNAEYPHTNIFEPIWKIDVHNKSKIRLTLCQSKKYDKIKTALAEDLPNMKKNQLQQQSCLVLFLLEIRRRYKTSTDQYPSKLCTQAAQIYRSI